MFFEIKYSSTMQNTIRKRSHNQSYCQTPEECYICLEPVYRNKIKLKCPHVFHTECLMEWINSDYNKIGGICPVCSNPIVIKKHRSCRRKCVIL